MNNDTHDDSNPHSPRKLAVRDLHHDAQLLRDLALINARTAAELGPLPAGGLPMKPKRKPKLSPIVAPVASSMPTPPPAPARKPEDDPMKLRQVAAAAMVPLAVAAAGCSDTTNRLGITNVHIQQNPHPKELYELTFTIHDAPGPFDSVVASAAYEISNKECVPTQAISGAKPSPNPVIPLEITRVDEHTYRGYVYFDLLKDDDYYGLGICHWTLASVGPEMKVRSVVFGGDIHKNEILEHKKVTWYLWKPDYNQTDASAAGYGVPFSVYSTAPDKSKYFPLTLDVERSTP